ncbi:MAG: hypothetical protein IT195_08635 [Microthrixaceae bacterium]|nr:hypothetical protein [Microthrixaceae bacterium]
MSDLDLRGIDLDAALERTYRRHDELRLQAGRRHRWIAGAAMTLLLVVGAVSLAVFAGDDPEVRSPVPAAGGDDPTAGPTHAEPESLVPPGYSLLPEVDGIVVLRRENSAPVDPVQPEGDPSVAVSSTNLRVGTLVAADRARDGSVVRVRFDCVSAGDVIDEVRYSVRDGRLVIDGSIAGEPGTACVVGQPGPALSLPMDPPVPAGIEIVTGSLRTP